jgi:hypothetical protein
MIRKYKEEFIAECNECGNERYGGVIPFLTFIDQLKDAGWGVQKIGDTWMHTCPDCRVEEAKQP